jgi:hypothetical protein
MKKVERFDTSGLGGSKDKRVADVEKRAANLVGTTRRTLRGRHEVSPDMSPVRASNGDAIQCDAKSRREPMPKWVIDGLAACERYTPGAHPVLLVYPIGCKPIAILPAEAFARLAGFALPQPGEQLTLTRTEAPK